LQTDHFEELWDHVSSSRYRLDRSARSSDIK
jgi:hypothetical protein